MEKPLLRLCCLILSCFMIVGYLPALGEEDTEEIEEDIESSVVNVIELNTIGEERFVDNFKKPHPRIFVNDFESLRQKIKENYMMREWYSAVKKAADEAL